MGNSCDIESQLLEKYFDNSCSVREARRVLDWFGTPEGQTYLVERFRADLVELEEAIQQMNLSGLDSRRLWNAIQLRIRREAGGRNRGTAPDLFGCLVRLFATRLQIWALVMTISTPGREPLNLTINTDLQP